MTVPAPTRARAAAWPALVVVLVTAWAGTSGLGWRHLWVDEVDTAERSKAVLTWGYPRVVDASGELSLNTGGYELEDGETHRFSPWGQFYITAAGLGLGRVMGWSPDFSVRLPAVTLHTAAAGLLTWGCVALAGASAPAALAVGLSAGLDSVRLLYARQARHHAMVEFFIVLGLLGLGLLRQGRARGWWLLTLVTAVPAHLHPLSGAVFALTFLALLLVLWRQQVPGITPSTMARYVILPGAVSAVLLLVLARPWRQDSWSFAAGMASHALAHSPTWWGMAFLALSAGACWKWGQPRAAVVLLVLLLVPVVAVQPLSLTTVSNYRYFIHLPLLFVLWPLVLGPLFEGRRHSLVWLGVMVALWGPDLDRTARMGVHAGVRVALLDAQQEKLGTRQPLHEVVDFLKANARPTEPILWDMVPQYVNWYLPGHQIALLPDLAARVPSTKDSPWWNTMPRPAVWHVWFPRAGAGPWDCSGHCDVRAVDANPDNPQQPYTLHSGRLGLDMHMCPAFGTLANRIANAPFLLLTTGELEADGAANEYLVVSRLCPSDG